MPVDRWRRWTALCIVPLLCLLLAGCGRLPAAPAWQRAGAAAARAAAAPATWVPLAGALVFAADDFDRRTADWAGEETPLFGSPGRAESASDWLAVATAAACAGTVLAAPADAPDGRRARFDAAVVGSAAFAATDGTAVLAKEAIGRERPDGSGGGSLPSRHAADAAVLATVAARNLETLPLAEGGLVAARAGLTALAAGTAWARVEAQQHYPSDVLAGLALGHFFGQFFTEAFLPGESMVTLQSEIGLRDDRFALRLHFIY